MKFIPHIIIILVVGTLFYFGVQSFEVSANEPPGGSGLSAEIARGQTLYTQNCQVCHGEDLQGTADYPNLRLFQKNESAFRATVTGGFYPMPSFEDVLSEDEQHSLWLFISANSDLPD